MGQRTHRARRRPDGGPELDVHQRSRVGTPAEAVLALQAGAGNQAVTRVLQRFYEKPGATTTDVPRTGKGTYQEGWTQNGRPPLDRALVQEGSKWYAWSQ